MADNSNPRNTGTRRPIVERRRQKNDWVVKSISVFSVVGWIASAVMLVFLTWAKPQGPNQWDNWRGNKVQVTGWNITQLQRALGVQILVLLVCVVGFFFNMKRHHRKSDKYNRWIIVLGIISIVVIALFLINFSSYLF